MYHDSPDGESFSPDALDPRLIDEMIADHNDGVRCEQAITEEEIEQMRLDNMTAAESREYCLSIVREMREVTQRIMAKNQARRDAGKAVVA